MNVLVKRALSLGAPALVGGGAGVAATVAATSGAHEAITIAIGDTLTPRFSVKTDTVLRVVGASIVAARCGTSNIFLRNWQGTTQRSADTVDVTIPCAPPADTLTPVASVDVCFANPDSAAAYGIHGDTLSPTAEQLSHIKCDSTATLFVRNGRTIGPPQRSLAVAPLSAPPVGSIMFQSPTITAPPAVAADPWAASRASRR